MQIGETRATAAIDFCGEKNARVYISINEKRLAEEEATIKRQYLLLYINAKYTKYMIYYQQAQKSTVIYYILLNTSAKIFI